MEKEKGMLEKMDDIKEEYEKKYYPSGRKEPSIKDVFSGENKIARIIYAAIAVVLFLHAFRVINFIPVSFASNSAFMGVDKEGIPIPLWAIIAIAVAIAVTIVIAILMIISAATKKERPYRAAAGIYYFFEESTRGILSGSKKALSGLGLGIILTLSIPRDLLKCVYIGDTICDSHIFIFAASVFLMISILYNLDLGGD